MSLTLVCAAKGYSFSIVTSDAFSEEKRSHRRGELTGDAPLAFGAWLALGIAVSWIARAYGRGLPPSC